MDNRPIGFFDSGVGGLTCVKPLLEQLPNERVIYFGDTARTPYGSKGIDTVKAFSLQIARFLRDQDVKMLAIACNTVSSVAMEYLQEQLPDIPVIGTIQPAASRIAACCDKTNSIGIMATKVTVNSGAYQHAILKENSDLNIHAIACPALVPLIEEGLTKDTQIAPIIHHYLDDFVAEHRIDTLVLGCTHYPHIKGVIQKEFPGIHIINPSQTLADAVAAALKKNDMLAVQPKRDSIFYASDISDSFLHMMEELSGDRFTALQMEF